jgi:flagellar motor protein MotB
MSSVVHAQEGVTSSDVPPADQERYIPSSQVVPALKLCEGRLDSKEDREFCFGILYSTIRTAVADAVPHTSLDGATGWSEQSALERRVSFLTLQVGGLRGQLESVLELLDAAKKSNIGLRKVIEEQKIRLKDIHSLEHPSDVGLASALRQNELLNQQVGALRRQLSSMQSLLDEAEARDAAAQVQLESLGSELNTALARVAAEERRRRQFEEAERVRLEEKVEALKDENQRLLGENQDLDRYRSEFFGRLRDVLGGRDGVRIEGDRFVFSSEVLFPPAEASLSADGKAQIANVAAILRDVAQDIPNSINWIISVDGHTDNLPPSRQPLYADSWELSQAQSLSVVRYLIEDLGVPPKRLSANGFGEYQPVSMGNTPEARALNRRIELTLNLNEQSPSRTDSVKSPITAAANCWVLDVGSTAAQVSITVQFEVDESGSVLASSFRLLSADGGTGAAVDTAFQAARRAVLRCQGEGYLPPNGLAEEQTVELAFDVGIPAVQLLR